MQVTCVLRMLLLAMREESRAQPRKWLPRRHRSFYYQTPANKDLARSITAAARAPTSLTCSLP